MSLILALVLLAAAVSGPGQTYVRAEGADGGKRIDVWDFGGAAQPGDAYTNHITVNALNGLKQDGYVASNGVFAKNTSFGDLTVATTGGHFRLYYKDGGVNGTSSYGSPTIKTFGDGYTNNGTIYFPGNNTPSTHYIKLDHVRAGDHIAVYGFYTNSGSGTPVFHFELTNESGASTTAVSDPIPTSAQIFTYHAMESGTLKIYAGGIGSGIKPNIARIIRTPGIQVSGRINLNGYALSDYSLVFRNQATSGTLPATLHPDGTFEATLTAGYSFTAALQGVSSEYSISDSTKTVTTSLSDLANGMTGLQLDVAKTAMATVSGAVAGFASGYDTANLRITLNPPADSLAPAVEAVWNKSAMTYSADVRAGVSYTVSISGVNDYELTGGTQVQITADTRQDITVAPKALHTATGLFTGLPSGVTVSSLTFTHVDDGYVYSGTVTGSGTSAGYTVRLRDGAYAVSAVISDPAYTTIGHVVVSGGDTTKGIKFSSKTALPPLPRVSDLYVGDSTKEHNFATVKEALAAAARMNPSSEAERITIHIAPGTYRAQLKIATPYISLVNANPGQEVKITWYYGVGYDYYSAGPDGSYQEDRAFDKYAKGYAGNFKWGATVFLTSAATGFRAENIVFENSFNKYMTQEELEDGVQVSAVSPTNLTVRTAGLDAASRAATERAAAMGIEADRVEFFNCSFISSQDTLYTGNSVNRLYFKNSYIEGNTDYIFGDGNAVFDDCILNFTGYSDQAAGGYITAAKPNAAQNPKYFGYLFRDSTITWTKSKAQAPGYFGRPWGQEAKVKFLDTKLEDASIIAPQGWTTMGSSTPENAGFYEYNTRYNGVPADTAARRGKVLGGEAAVTDVRAYFGHDWTPSYYTPGSVTAPVLRVDSAGETGVVLSWQNAASTKGSVLYSVYRDGQKAGVTTETAYTVSGLSPNTSYRFQVAAVTTAGDTAMSSEVQAITAGGGGIPSIPAAPVIAATPGDGSATITWNTVTGATYYTVKSYSVADSVYRTIHTTDSPTVTRYTYSGLTNGVTYYFVVTASNEWGESAHSNAAEATPSPKGTVPGGTFRPDDFIGYDIGSPAIAGSSSFDEDTNAFTLTGSGTGINKNATGLDQFYLKAVKLKGDYTISAKVSYDGYAPGKLGSMGLTIRESLDPNSYHFTQVEQYASTAVGGRKMFRYAGSSNGSNSNMPLSGTAYLQLTKSGDKITSIISSSPIPAHPAPSPTLVISTATAVDLDTPDSTKELYAGLMVTSSNAAKTATAVFEDVRIVMADGKVVFDSNAGKPVAPKQVAAKPYDRSALITWEPLSTATFYTVKQSGSEQGPFAEVQTVTGSVYQALVTGLENDKKYYFVVTASNASGESVPSKAAGVIPNAESVMPPVLTMTSAEPAGEVFSALLPLSGSVNKEVILTIRHNGAGIPLDGANTGLPLGKNGTFSKTLVLIPGTNVIDITAQDTYGNTTSKTYTVLYTYKAAAITFQDADGQAVAALSPGKTIVVTAGVENHIAPAQDAVMIVGLYDSGNNLVAFITTAETLARGESDLFYAKLVLPDDVSGYSLKVFIWDGVTTMRPISDVFMLK